MITPYFKIKLLPQAYGQLKPRITFAILGRTAHQIRANQGVYLKQKAHLLLLATINEWIGNPAV